MPTANRQPPTANRQPPTANRQPPTANRQPPTNDGLYSHLEQILLDCLRKAQAAAQVGDLETTLRMQASFYAALPEIIGRQTQKVLQVAEKRKQGVGQ
ncbi:MAG: hypothetical protein PHE17_20140 [Thiothrix sp.]|uniref:hypothetical protein n=1 Tax=Thiothrix sp. TaxID=1032 RepID=UPI0026347243|nr:hypothetical protein [Thiothrix sp.]MDD5395341.1 hypothetical protein [Thiothrix sp.]